MTPFSFEQVLLKLLFVDEKVRDKVIPFLSPVVFDDKKHMNISKHILQFVEKYNYFPKVSEMKVDLEDEETFNRLMEIINLDISEYSDEFILDIIEDFLRKKLIHNINVDIAMALSNDKMDDVKKTPDKLREAIAFSFDNKVGLDLLNDEDAVFEALHNKDKVIPSGITDLDKIIEGGFHEKTLTLFLAATNKGKSLIMSSLAVDSLLQNKNVLYITCEMSETKVSERLLANLFDVDIYDLKTLQKSDFHFNYDKIKSLVHKKFIIKEYPTKTINTNHIRNLLKELEVRKKFIPDIIYVDYIGIMNATYNNKGDNTYTELKRISEEVRAIAGDYGMPIVSAIQTNRQGLEETELDMTNIADSIGIAATADIIVGVVQTDELRNLGKFIWQVIKNRYGINKQNIHILVDYCKMRVSNDPNSPSHGMSGTLNKNDNKSTVNQAVQETVNVLNKDTTDKFKKIINFE